MNSNTLFQAITLVLVMAHAGALICVYFAPRGFSFLLAINSILSSAIILYTASRARYLLAAVDWPYLALVAFEMMVLAGAFWATREHRLAVVWSYVAFGIHSCAGIAAVVFSFTFKITKLF